MEVHGSLGLKARPSNGVEEKVGVPMGTLQTCLRANTKLESRVGPYVGPIQVHVGSGAISCRSADDVGKLSLVRCRQSKLCEIVDFS